MSAENAGRAFEREEDAIQEAYADGRIDNAEMWRQQRELQRSYREEAEEAAQDAYNRERDQW